MFVVRWPALAASAQRLQSIPGVGLVTVTTQVAFLPELGQLGRKAIAALVSVAPPSWERGRTHLRRSIWGGRAIVRRTWSMATLAAMRINPLRRAFTSMCGRQGRRQRWLALTACMRKLLILANALLWTGQPWDPGRVTPSDQIP